MTGRFALHCAWPWVGREQPRDKARREDTCHWHCCPCRLAGAQAVSAAGGGRRQVGQGDIPVSTEGKEWDAKRAVFLPALGL